MSTEALGALLAVYAWFPLTVLIFMMMLIARFYGRFSHRQTYYWAYAVPIVCFGGAAVRYAALSNVRGDALGDGLASLGGVVLIALSVRLAQQMLHGGQNRTAD